MFFSLNGKDSRIGVDVPKAFRRRTDGLMMR
jgi:hypothetical protein